MLPRRDVRRDFARYAGVGTHFAATIGVFAGFGYWVDGKWGTQPWLLLVGVFLGFGLGLVSMIAKLNPSSQNTNESSAAPNKSDRPQ